MSRIVIDPVTRIEGHLRIEVQVEQGVVTDAWSAGMMFRGIEQILRGRDPRQAWVLAQRICGVCTVVHALASVRAVENALGIVAPDNARIVRNLLAGTQFVQDHVIHFYHLHALDWVDVVSALAADPAQTSALAQSLSDWPQSSAEHFAGVRDRLRTLMSGSQQGLFANGYWGHPAYRLPAEVNLLVMAHYLEALQWQREIAKVQALLGGKNPHPQTFLVGGMAVPIDPDRATAINGERLAEMKALAAQALSFVSKVYLPELLTVAGYYKEWAGLGRGVGNFLAYGDFPSSTGDSSSVRLLPPGVLYAGKLGSGPRAVYEQQVNEYVARAWYTYGGGDDIGRHPLAGETTPVYTGPQPPFAFLNTDGKYSWTKAPRYNDLPMEVGPLARMLIAYRSGHGRVTPLLNEIVAKLGIGLDALCSTLGRMVARSAETLLVAEQLGNWLDELEANMLRGELAIHNGERWEPSTWPAAASGWGSVEAPRGALGHWVSIEQGKIAQYQAVVPTTWNGSPRDARGQRGPWEEALIGTPVADPERPLEILRTIHAFDPCLACAVHLVDRRGREGTRIQTL